MYQLLFFILAFNLSQPSSQALAKASETSRLNSTLEFCHPTLCRYAFSLVPPTAFHSTLTLEPQEAPESILALDIGPNSVSADLLPGKSYVVRVYSFNENNERDASPLLEATILSGVK